MQGNEVADAVYALIQSPHNAVQAKAILLHAFLVNAFPGTPCLATTPSVAAQVTQRDGSGVFCRCLVPTSKASFHNLQRQCSYCEFKVQNYNSHPAALQ